MKTLNNLREKISVRVNIRMSKIMSTPVKVGVGIVEPYHIRENSQKQLLPTKKIIYGISLSQGGSVYHSIIAVFLRILQISLRKIL